MNSITTDNQITLSKAALIAGLGLLIMALTVPFAEFYIFPRLLTDDPTETATNILNHNQLFTTGIFLHFITLVCDIIVAWALYIFLKPVNKNISLLTAWTRLIFTALSLMALTNLVKVLNLIANYSKTENSQVAESVQFYLSSFKLEWSFALVLFGIYLILLGYLVFKAPYIPNIFGILVAVAGFGYLIQTLGTFFFPELNLDFLFFTFFGELIFMGWLLVKGRKVSAITT